MLPYIFGLDVEKQTNTEVSRKPLCYEGKILRRSFRGGIPPQEQDRCIECLDYFPHCNIMCLISLVGNEWLLYFGLTVRVNVPQVHLSHQPTLAQISAFIVIVN